MSSNRNWPSSGGKGINGDIVKQGYLKKLKTMRKKYFVLRGDSGDCAARLEYYDNEKKWKTNQAPKRSIILKTCFNINKRTDIRNKWVIALYTKKDSFCIVLDSEEEMESWLKGLLELQLGEDLPEGEPIKPTFAHVWQVSVLSKELGGRSGITGSYHLCLTDQTLSLVKVASDDKLDTIEFSLQKIRRCGHVDAFFYMEVGQCTVTGPGNLWMQTEDTNIAENMHNTILSACRNCAKKELQPKSRNRSSSANEASKPISFMQRWPTHTASSGSSGGGGSGGLNVNHQRTYSFPLSPLPPARRASTGTRPSKHVTSNFIQSSLTGVRERCDSLPSRPRTSSEGAPHLPHPPKTHLGPSRPHSMYNRGISYSPPVGSSPVSPASGACSTDSAGSSLSMDGDTGEPVWETETGRFGHSLTPEEPAIMEENPDDYWQGEEEKLNNNIHTDRSLSLPIQSPLSLNNAAYRKHSPNISSGFKSSSPSQGSYMDMCSPCGSSPLDTPGNYIPISPGECRTPLYGRAGSVNHSRGSSLAEEGYVHMAPTSSDDAYVDMDQKSNQRIYKQVDRYQSGDTSAGSSCSITSGTPSAEAIKFSEFPLDKVATYFHPDDDITPAERPARAYSVGSRPVNNNTRTDLSTQSECERVRAFSLGSHVRFLGQVPFTKTTPQFLSSSHSSVEPSDDMMVIDFSKKGKHKNRKKQSSIERLSVPAGNASMHIQSPYSHTPSEVNYVEMSPRASPSLGPSPPKTSRLVSALFGKSPPKPSIPECPFSKSSPPVSGYPSPSLGRVPETEPGYMDMTSGPRGELHGVSPPLKSVVQSPTDDPYVEMKPGHSEARQILAKNTKARTESFPSNDNLKLQLSSPPIKQALLTTKGSKDDYLDMSLKRKTSVLEDNNNSKIVVGHPATSVPGSKDVDDYVEMNLGNSKQKSGEGGKLSENEYNYLNMSIKKERKGSRKDRNRHSSQPITIQSNPKDTGPIFTVAGRKHSTGTPPKVPSYLPLGSTNSPNSSPHSTLERNRVRKNSIRRESKDAGSGFITPTGSTGAIFAFSLNSPVNSPGGYESSAKCPVDATSGTVRISYTPEEIESHPELNKNSDSMDNHVNFQPKNVEESDYTPMQPLSIAAEANRKMSAPSMSTVKLRPMEKLLTGLGSLTIGSPAIITVPPAQCSIVHSESDTLLSGSETPRLSEEDLNASTVKGGNKPVSRASSVSSMGDKELHYASLDLKRSGSENEVSSRGLKTQTSLTESSSASTPSPNIMPDSSAFTYAKIDFEKSAAPQKLRH